MTDSKGGAGPNAYFCQLCVRNLESSHHLFWSCQETGRVWAELGLWHSCSALTPVESWHHDSSTAIVQGILEQIPH